MLWTPDSSQILVYWTESNKSNKAQTSVGRPGLSKKTVTSTSETEIVSEAILLSSDKLNDEAEIRDASTTIPVLLAQWIQSLDIKDAEKLAKLPESISR